MSDMAKFMEKISRMDADNISEEDFDHGFGG